jgi:RpiR family carbohydrate utilization transcriptional regulator
MGKKVKKVQTHTILARVRAVLPALRASERKVAETLLRNPEAVISKSITQLAEDAGTSEPTVIRFCRKLELSGYMELKLSIARELPSGAYIHENVAETDTLPVVFHKLFMAAGEALSETLKALDVGLLDRAVKALAAAGRIEFYGQGGSAVVARDAYHKFFRLGIPCSCHDDPHMQVMSASLLKAGDVLLAISHTGSTRDILESVRVAKESGATVIGITGADKTPLSRLCDITISVLSKEAALVLAPMTSRLVQLAVIDVLFVTLAMGSLGHHRQQLDRVKRALIGKRF